MVKFHLKNGLNNGSVGKLVKSAPSKGVIVGAGSIPVGATMKKKIIIENINKNNPYEKWIIKFEDDNVLIIHQGPELGRLKEFINIKGNIKIEDLN